MKLTVTAALGFIANITIAQTISKTDSNIQNYIAKYKDIAVQEQIRTGIPAAIKLAQGIHETNFGNSELCKNANNHFGIKCKSTWTGNTYKYTDDAKDECFRMYDSDLASYKDHSNFLIQNQRYAKLFTYDINDYKSWAHGLKASGYATNPKYAILIINLIEKYDLNQFTLLASNTAVLPNAVALVNNTATNNAQLATYSYKSNSSPTSNQPVPHSKLKSNAIEGDNEAENNDQDNTSINVPFYTPTSLNGLKGFYGKKGDMLLDYATKSNIRYTKLLALNSLPDAPLEADMFVYTEKKLKKGLQEKYTVLAGETLIQISQKTGVELQQLKLLNKLIEGVEVKSGEIINLQFDRNYSPEVYIPQIEKASKSSNNNKKKEDDNYIVNTNKKQNTQKDAEHYTFPNASKATSNKDDKQTINNKQTESRYGNKETIIAAKNTPEIKNEKKSEQLVPDKNEQNQIDNKPATTNYNNLTPYEKLKLHMEKNGSAQEEFKGPSTKHELITINTKAEENNNTYISVAPTSAKSQTNKPVNNTAKVSATTKTHKVKKGDTLFSIAHKYNVSVKQLQDWNKVTPKTLTVGKTIKVSK